MIPINDIKNNKLVLNDYINLIKEVIYSIEACIEIWNLIINESNNTDEQQQNYRNKIIDNKNKIDKLNAYLPIFTEYISSNFSNTTDDDDLNIFMMMQYRMLMKI